jgi:cell surface protein SprA
LRAKQTFLKGLLAFSCLAVLMSAYAGNVAIRPRNSRILLTPPPPQPAADSPRLKYPIKDREGDFVTDKTHDPFYLQDPPAIERNVEYDPESGMYVVTETVAGQNVRPPMYMTYEDYLKYTEKWEREQYWRERANAVNLIEDKSLIPPIDVKKKIFKDIFGNGKIEIRPQGNVEVTLGGNFQKTANPNIPLRNRRTGGFDFDMNINLNVVGKIGDKLQLGIKYNTQSGFDFENQIKLGYNGDEDDIIKEIALGNVSLPLTTRLITGSQTLFGVKTQFKFGRLTWTSVMSQQKAKKETVTIEGGAQRQLFEIRADQYEENRHFFLGQFFRNQYNKALSNLPNIESVVNVTRIEVWITNRTGATANVRDVVGFMDLGENVPFSPNITGYPGDARPRNEANDLYAKATSSPSNRFVDNVVATLQGPGFNLQQGQDYEKTYARKLNDNEYNVNRQLGYISLNTQLNPNEVLAVAYQYEYNGEVFQVGEFSNQIPPDSNATSKVLYLKMLRGNGVRPLLPMWNLMMKNIYSLGAYQLSNDEFRLDVYYDDPGGGQKRFLPKGCLQDKQLLKVLNLDNVNMNGDPQPDGLFDFIPNVTILTQNGRLVFPVIEPFGEDLTRALTACGSGAIASQYTYQQLYDSTRFIAQQFPEYNRFIIKGQYKGAGGKEISLGAANIPRGSVTVTAGGQRLQEGTHYTIDYSLGRITIIDPTILNSGQQIKVDFENNNLFATQVRNLFGTRLDYQVNSKLNIGGTLMQLSERPFTQKVNIGDDPIRNTIMGFDIKYDDNAPWLTKALDKLPVYATKEMSTISAYGEFAYLKPGHSKAINNSNKEGQVYIDDFEGTSNGYDLKTPSIGWKLASTPRNSPSPSGGIQFPEGTLISDFRYGVNRAKLAWYRIDNSFFTDNTSPDVVFNNKDLLNNHYVRLIPTQEVFPNRPNQTIDQNLYTFDLAYYPKERGPYNFEVCNGQQGISAGIDANTGELKDPQSRWGGVMRAIDNNDLEATNVEFIEFWMLDPFLYNTNNNGRLYFHLGYISEDILRDSRMQFENGIVADTNTLDATIWGHVPRLPPLVNAFDNDPNLRPIQDVGFDGLSNADEQPWNANFLTQIQGCAVPAVYNKLQGDPASDNYRFFNDVQYDNEPNILTRYKDYTNPEGNSPVQENAVQTTAGTNLPDAEDLNRDNTLNENEEYFQYEVNLYPGMDIGNNPYIVSKIENTGQDNTGVPSRWLQFRVPIRQYQARVGSIPDFKSIQFMRMVLTGFQDSVIVRFGTLELVRNQWRTYYQSLNDPCEEVPTDGGTGTFFNVASVSVEENSGKTPVNYILPPGIEREQAIGAQTNQFVQQNEQALTVTACDLKDCKMKAVFKNIVLDLRRYKRLRMFIHANRVDGEPTVRDKEVTAVLRIGSDFKDNYYQYEIPLTITPDGQYNSDNTSDRETVWPEGNNIDITLQDFIDLKLKRNTNETYPRNVPYSTTDAQGRILTIVGNPDIGGVKTIMLGIRNPSKDDPNNPLPDGDDGQPKCVEVWFNEMRVTGFEESGGMAAVGSLAIKLADLGNIGLSGGMHTKQFGQIEQRVDQRFKDNFYQYDFTSSIELGRFFPVKAGIRIPFLGSYAQTFSTPEFDPYQFDIPTKTMRQLLKDEQGSTAVRTYLSQIQTRTTRRGFNFSNVRIVPQTKAKKPHIYDPGNFNFTYAYNELLQSDPFVQKNSRKTWLGVIGWTFAPQGKDLYPFKKSIKSKSKWLDIIRDFNFNPMPSNLAFNSEWNREFVEIKLRPLSEDEEDIPSTYSKIFRWTRTYNFRYNPFKALSLEYAATNVGRIDEPDGKIDTKEEKKLIWDEIFKGGRNTNFNQNYSASYNIPINKLPAFDFITANVSYGGNYTWTALPQYKNKITGEWEQNPLGNIINNSQNFRGKVDLNFKKIYDKVPFLKAYNSPSPTMGDKKENDKKREAIKKAREKIKDELAKLKDKRTTLKENLKKAMADEKMDTAKKRAEVERLKREIKANKKAIAAKKKDYRSKQPPSNPFISLGLRPVLLIKRASIEYKETKSTTLPGFTPYSRVLGTDYRNMNAPGYDFAFGWQPGDRFFKGIDADARDMWLDEAARNGWITRDTLLNQKFMQNRGQRIDATATLEPFSDFKVDLTLFYDKTVNHSEFFKAFQNGDLYEYRHVNPVDAGSYSISWVSISTFFKKIDKQGYSETYSRFEDAREVISNRLGVENPNSVGTYQGPAGDSLFVSNPAYASGYGPKAQEVLIPSFLAAYTGKDPGKINLNPFRSFPLPNWRFSYSGLSKIKWMQKVVQSLTISHGYNSTLTVNSFQTSLDYRGDGTPFGSNKIDTLNGNFFSYYNMPSIVINEQLSPLVGIDVTFKNNVTAKFDYKKSRTLTVNFADFQLIENNSEQFTIGAGYKIKGLKLPIKLKNGKKIRLDNDLNFRFDFSYRDNITINHRIDEPTPQITSGNRTITIQPSIDYVVSKQLNIRLFFDQTMNIPKISSGFPTTNTRAGLQLRFTLAE